MTVEKSGSMGAVFALILGIASVVAWLLPIVGIPLAVLALILGIRGRESADRGVAIAGIVLSTVALILGLVNSLFGAYLGFTGQLFPGLSQSPNVVYVTATPRPVVRRTASETPTPPETGWRGLPVSETLPPPWADCIDDSSVRQSDIGKTRCVRGDVTSAYWDPKQNAFFVFFSKEPGHFYILSYGGGWNNIGPGSCVYATHEIGKLGPSPVMVIDPAEPLYICD